MFKISDILRGFLVNLYLFGRGDYLEEISSQTVSEIDGMSNSTLNGRSLHHSKTKRQNESIESETIYSIHKQIVKTGQFLISFP